MTTAEMGWLGKLTLKKRSRIIIMNLKLIACPIILSMLAACATPTVVQQRKVGDSELTCAQLKAEYVDAQEFEAKARKEQGVTGKNVAAAVLFWPALVGTYSNTQEAIKAAQDRQRHLETIAAGKNCKL
jgi:hypothetical protein